MLLMNGISGEAVRSLISKSHDDEKHPLHVVPGYKWMHEVSKKHWAMSHYSYLNHGENLAAHNDSQLPPAIRSVDS